MFLSRRINQFVHAYKFLVPIFAGRSRGDSDWILVHADQEYVFQIQLSRINKMKVRKTLALCQLVNPVYIE